MEYMMFVVLFAVGGGQGGDLLDFAPTESYWQMREERVVDVATMSAVIAQAQSTVSDKLMAIRTLGELGKADDADKAAVLAVLGPLVESNEPFVGQYAKRSIAWVKGQDPEPRPEPTAEQLASDLALLPHDCELVGQLRVSNGIGPADLNALVPDFKMRHGPNRQEMLQEIAGAVVQAAGMIGNARIDTLTLGMKFQPNGDDPELVMLVARGEYDRIGVQLAIETLTEEEDQKANYYSIGETEVISIKDGRMSFVLLMPSDQQLVFMIREEDGAPGGLPIDETADLIEKGDAQLAFNKGLTKQIEAIDRSEASIWLAMQIPAFMKQGAPEVFGSFDFGHAQAVRDTEGNLEVTWTAEGSNAAAVAENVAVMNEGLIEGRREIREEMAREPDMKAMFGPLVKMMDSIKIESDGKVMTGGMTVPGGLGMMMPFMMMGNAGHAAQDVQAAAVQRGAVQRQPAIQEVVIDE